MLKWLGGADAKEAQDANLAEIKQALAAISPDDPVRAVHDGVHCLESLGTEGNLPLAHRYAAVDMLDAAMRRHAQRLLDQYLALKPQAKFQEGLLWRAASGYWKALGDAYLACITLAANDKAAPKADKTAAGFQKNMAQAVARAMRAEALQIKWILMRYGYVGDSYWYTVAQLYRRAGAGSYLDEEIEIYSGPQGKGTLRQEFLRTLMLGVSSTGGLSPVKQNIAERAIAHFSKAFVSSPDPMAGCNFFFDLNGGVPPARVLASAPRDAQLFYFGAGDALDDVQGTLDAINDSGALPSQMFTGLTVGVDEAADTLTHLAFNWEKELPARDSERRKVASTVQVTHGFDSVLSVGAVGQHETWVVENASAEGYGMIVPERRGEWLQVGVLLGLLPETGKPQWGTGVVRRVETDARGQRRAGIQVISRAVAPATLRTVSLTGERGAAHSVVLLDAAPSRSGYMQALLQPEAFTLEDEVEATRTSDGATFNLMPSGVVESGADFDRVRFKVEGAGSI